MIETFLEELNYILDGGFREGDSIFVKIPSNNYNSHIVFPMMGKESYNVLITFRESWYTLEQKLRRSRVPNRLNLIIDAYSKSNRVEYEDNRVIFIDSPSLLNDISYEYNSVISKLSIPVFTVILTVDSALEKNEANSLSKFLEVMQTRTIQRGVFMLVGTLDMMKHKNFEIDVIIDKDIEILKSKQMISEIFFKTEPMFTIL